ncbi:ATP-grasp domain-containing protein [Vibrio harveyi]
MNVLLTCVGRRKYLVDYFKSEPLVSLVVGADMQNSAPGFSGCDICEIVPSIYDENYIDNIVSICTRNKIDLLVSLNDMELPILSESRELIESVGTKLAVSNSEVIDICSDKWLTYQFAQEHNILTPKTYLSPAETIDECAKGLVNYPFIIKPRWGSASFGLFKANNEDELKRYFSQCKKNLKSSYLNDFAKHEDSVIIQQFIQGQEYGVDVFCSLEGDFLSSTQKIKVAMRSGETDKATTVKNAFLSDIAKLLATKLKHVGNLDCDFFQVDGQFYLLEMNPRFGGGYPFSHEAGSNYVRNLIESALGMNFSESSYAEGMTFSKCDVLVPSIGN